MSMVILGGFTSPSFRKGEIWKGRNARRKLERFEKLCLCILSMSVLLFWRTFFWGGCTGLFHISVLTHMLSWARRCFGKKRSAITVTLLVCWSCGRRQFLNIILTYPSWSTISIKTRAKIPTSTVGLCPKSYYIHREINKPIYIQYTQQYIDYLRSNLSSAGSF